MRLNEHKNTGKDYRCARDLRNNASPVERKLWSILRAAAVSKSLKFRRQHAVHPYIADFACLQARLLIEIDGASHDNRQNYDRQREVALKMAGYHVMRFSNDDVLGNVAGVVETIINKAENLLREAEDQGKRNSPLPMNASSAFIPSPRGGGK